jgi:CDP-4-dehydro-6-deoxyglucose reductase
MHALCEEWANTLEGFQYTPVVSDANAEDKWQGRTGFVHQAVLNDYANLSDYQVYACGAPIVIESAKRDFVAKSHLPADEFYADSFTSEADLAKN